MRPDSTPHNDVTLRNKGALFSWSAYRRTTFGVQEGMFRKMLARRRLVPHFPSLMFCCRVYLAIATIAFLIPCSVAPVQLQAVPPQFEISEDCEQYPCHAEFCVADLIAYSGPRFSKWKYLRFQGLVLDAVSNSRNVADLWDTFELYI